MKILIVDDEEAILDILEFAVATIVTAEIIMSESGNDAIKILDEQADIDLLICDYNMPNGSGGDVYQHVVNEKLDIKYVLCSSDSPDMHKEFSTGDNFFGNITKPDIVNGVEDIIAKIDNSVVQTEELGEYIQISPLLLKRMGTAAADIYIKLNESKYLKYLNKEDPFSNQDFEKYQGMNVLYFVLGEIDRQAMVTYMQKSLFNLLSDKNIEFSDKIIKAHGIVSDSIREFGINEEVAEMTKKYVSYSLKTIEQNKSLNNLLQDLLNSSEYHAKLTGLVSHVSCAIAKELKWQTETVLYKLTMCAMMQDVYAPTEHLAAPMYKSEFDSFPTAEKSYILNHVEEAAEAVNSLKDIPPDIDQLITQHHELPNGTGFPAGIDHAAISPLSATIIISNIIAREMIAKNSDINIKELLSSKKDHLLLNRGNFKNVYNAAIAMDFFN